mgnify:CR=1 FL=1
MIASPVRQAGELFSHFFVLLLILQQWKYFLTAAHHHMSFEYISHSWIVAEAVVVASGHPECALLSPDLLFSSEVEGLSVQNGPALWLP